MLLQVPRKLGGDVGYEVAARPQTVVVTTHPELTVLWDGQSSGPGPGAMAPASPCAGHVHPPGKRPLKKVSLDIGLNHSALSYCQSG